MAAEYKEEKQRTPREMLEAWITNIQPRMWKGLVEEVVKEENEDMPRLEFLEEDLNLYKWLLGNPWINCRSRNDVIDTLDRIVNYEIANQQRATMTAPFMTAPLEMEDIEARFEEMKTQEQEVGDDDLPEAEAKVPAEYNNAIRRARHGHWLVLLYQDIMSKAITKDAALTVYLKNLPYELRHLYKPLRQII